MSVPVSCPFCTAAFALSEVPPAGRTNQDPQDLLKKADVPDAVFATLRRLDLGLEHIDHIVVGTRLGDVEQALRVTVVLALRRGPADEERFLHALEAKKPPTGKP